MAYIPEFIDRVNGIVDFWSDPCDAPWQVYFETALPPAGDALLTLLTFGLDDVMRGYFRPKNLRSGRHGRRGNRGRARPVGIPELGESIGKRLPGAQTARGRSVSQGVRNLWLVDGVIQRGLWYWLVADVVTEFLFDWASLIEEEGFCRKAESSSWLAEGDTTVFTPGGPQSYGGGFDTTYIRNASRNQASYGIGAPERGMHAHSAGTAVNNTSITTGVELLIIDAAGQGIVGQSGPVFVPPGGSAGVVASANWQGVGCQFGARSFEGGMTMIDGIVGGGAGSAP